MTASNRRRDESSDIEGYKYWKRREELRGLAALEGVGEVVEDKLIKVATSGLDEGKILEGAADGDDGADMVGVFPFNGIGAEDFLILSLRFGAEAVHALDEILNWLLTKGMKRRFGVCDEKLQFLLWVFLITLFVKDFESEGFNEDLIAALIHKPGLVERT